jgi:hypothetical protein
MNGKHSLQSGLAECYEGEMIREGKMEMRVGIGYKDNIC